MTIKVVIDPEFSVANGYAVGRLLIGLPKDDDDDEILLELRNRNHSVAWTPLKGGWGEYESADYRWSSYDLTEADDVRTPESLRAWIQKKVNYVRDTIATVLKEQYALQEECEKLAGQRHEIVFNLDGVIFSEEGFE